MKNKILIFGKGYIGSRIQEELGCAVSERKITSLKDALDEVRIHRPAVVINCIGYTGSNVDDCEKAQGLTFCANTFVPLILAEAAVRTKTRFVHLSSGCIYHFDYKRAVPITEERTPDFFDLFYSRSKIYAEQAILPLAKKYPFLIVRPRIPLDDRPHPKNILTKLIKYGKAIDVANSITYLPDFIKALKHLIKIKAIGIYNTVNAGALRYPELLDIYQKYNPDFKYKLVNFKALNLVRTNLILSTRKLRKSGFKLRDIHEVLEECVEKYTQY
jgi:3,5-epimerase/4-reductase